MPACRSLVVSISLKQLINFGRPRWTVCRFVAPSIVSKSTGGPQPLSAFHQPDPTPLDIPFSSNRPATHWRLLWGCECPWAR
ncbi:hypothetical protein EVAR_120_1 [Eumeta japonica]|uniref:Uncharacterized protein n=1 Tax=Eumeta variegata TaxID=151549 RepID=A0A4C1S8B7_EUMVA|nr:hypothetical protein EVAR_120_1 [Eumeta japonica]